MEALGLLKFWRSAAARAEASSEADDLHNATDDEDTEDDDSFFDLDFKSPERAAVEERDADSKKDCQFIESPRDVLLTRNDHFSNSKPLSPVTILRSAPKFKVFMLGFRKSSKCDKPEPNGETKASPLNQLSKSSKLDRSNRFSVNCRVADAPPVPVFTRDNSLRSKMMKENFDYETTSDVGSTEKSVPKYLKLIKPFYVKVSNKVKSTDSVTPSSSPVTAPVNLSPRKFSEGSRVGSFKIVTRNLVKSRSASSAATVGVAPPSIRRRDDSLLEQNDGIQGAILHCKKSFNSSSQDYSRLFRAASDPSHEKLRAPLRNSFEEQKRCSI
ncbi:probable membrane-associated kinase regulator 2 [Salvia miltiorrhiza]|uniref:probable membrane-associated kinase regulator 2 n=1 Tax=Salvia miltiorrhiza TaxID=226208 RepID=UPI0025ABBEE4|nr:probable membrane-associated kinase regulator 2 [Salvia miltiorrhiza]